MTCKQIFLWVRSSAGHVLKENPESSARFRSACTSNAAAIIYYHQQPPLKSWQSSKTAGMGILTKNQMVRTQLTRMTKMGNPNFVPSTVLYSSALM